MATGMDIDASFGFHRADTDEKAEAHGMVRDECRALALFFDSLLPDGREKSIALTKVQEAMWAANAALAIGMAHK